MKRTFIFAEPSGSVETAADGEVFRIPIYAGILKHPREDELPRLLADPAVLRKYTMEALRVAAWPLLRRFPSAWLLRHLPAAPMRPQRRRAILFLLG
jgi:hypothetical protein